MHTNKKHPLFCKLGILVLRSKSDRPATPPHRDGWKTTAWGTSQDGVVRHMPPPGGLSHRWLMPVPRWLLSHRHNTLSQSSTFQHTFKRQATLTSSRAAVSIVLVIGTHFTAPYTLTIELAPASVFPAPCVTHKVARSSRPHKSVRHGSYFSP